MTGGISSGVAYFGINDGSSDPPGICARAFELPESLSKPNSVSNVLPAVYFTNVRRETFIFSPYSIGTYARTKDGRFRHSVRVLHLPHPVRRTDPFNCNLAPGVNDVR